MSEHPKANALAENAVLKLVARLCMAFGVPILGVGLGIVASWISGISTAQETQRIFQSTQQLEVSQLKERVTSLERAGEMKGAENAQVLQRLATVEALMRNLADQSTSTRQSIDNLTRQLISERRSDATDALK